MFVCWHLHYLCCQIRLKIQTGAHVDQIFYSHLSILPTYDRSTHVMISLRGVIKYSLYAASGAEITLSWCSRWGWVFTFDTLLIKVLHDHFLLWKGLTCSFREENCISRSHRLLNVLFVNVFITTQYEYNWCFVHFVISFLYQFLQFSPFVITCSFWPTTL